MALYLVESSFDREVKDKTGFEKRVNKVQQALYDKNSKLIEVQVSKDFTKVFLIIESDEQTHLTDHLRELGILIELIKPVRLVGTDLEKIKKKADIVNYLVEWNLPRDLTMDKYLERKKKNSVHYAEVPEVTFSRTYVCEDMSKCLCFYDAPDESAVKRAREAVKAPIDSITEIYSDKKS